VSLLTHVLSVMLATNSTIAAVSNEVQAATGLSLPLVDPNDPAERALHQIMLDDDAAMESVAQSIQLNQTSATTGAAATPEQVKQGLRARLDIVRKEYEEFLKKFPDSARGHLAYGTFLNDIGEEYEGSVEYEKSRQLDPKNPAVWNDLANYYGENSPVTNAFAYYAKAIELDPAESVYYQNLATTVYLFRHDATNFYGITEAEVFDKSLALYRQAMALDPGNLPLATDYAQSFYEIHPLRTNDALVAWTNALALTHTETEREGVYVHLARLKIGIGRYDEARAHLAAITNADLLGIRHRLERNLADKEHPGTNAPPADAGD